MKMKFFNTYLKFLRENKKEITNFKLVLVIIVNIWLWIIFWKIIILNDLNLMNNNQMLNKASLILESILSILGIDILTPNMLKMIIIIGIIVIINLLILYFNQMLVTIILTVLGKYSYRSYTNYLKNQENLNYLGFEMKKEAVEEIETVVEAAETVVEAAETVVEAAETVVEAAETVVEQIEPQRIIIENTPIIAEQASNHTHWGLWLGLGLVLCLTIGLLIYSHNTLNNNISENNISISNNHINNINDKITATNNNLDKVNCTLTEKIRQGYQMIKTNAESSRHMSNNLEKKIDLIDEKFLKIEKSVKTVNANLLKVRDLSNTNALNATKQSLDLSNEVNEALTGIAEVSTTVRALSSSVTHLHGIVRILGQRLGALESRMNPITGSEAQTVSESGQSINPINLINLIKEDDEH